jgi:hypothetical protein
MFRSWPFRVFIFLILIGAIISIVLNYHSRSGHLENGPLDPLLSPDIARRSTDFEYAQLKEDRVVFMVRARTSTTLRAGEHQLEEVYLTRFNGEGEPADTIEARGAVYRIDRGDVEFLEDVLIRLENGAEIAADRAGADLATEVVSIRESFRFSQGDVKGFGKGLEYRIPQRIIRVAEGLSLDLPGGGGVRARSTSREAVYRLMDGHIRLTTDARIGLTESALEAQSIDLSFSPEHRIEGVAARGSARLNMSDVKSFAGDTIRIRLSDSAEANRLEVRGDRQAAPGLATQASFREITESGPHELNARYILGLFETGDGSGAEDNFRLSSIRAEGDVFLRSAPAGIDGGRADYFRGDVSHEDDRFESLLLSGNVRLERGGPIPTETLEAARVRLWLGPDSTLLAAEASDSPKMRIADAGWMRRIEAGERIRVDYEKGLIREARATGGCTLEREGGDERSRLTAAAVRLLFSEGQLDRALAEGDVRVVTSGESGDYTSRSDRLALEYEEGLLVRTTHEGGFQLIGTGEGERESKLFGERAVYDSAARMLSVDGSARARMRLVGPEEDLLTTADVISVSPDGEEIYARGAVESVMEGGEGRIVVTAGEMVLGREGGWVIYSNGPRLVQGANLITGREIRINRETRHLIVDEEVDSFLVDGAGSESRSYHVQARRLTLTDNGRKAVYEGDVAFEGSELRLDAPRLEAFFESRGEQSLDRVEATGGVVILERGRRWRAEEATYIRETDRVVAR